MISKSILFFFAYSIANSLEENSKFNSERVLELVSQPIKGLIPVSSV